MGKEAEQDLEELADEDHFGMVEEVLNRRKRTRCAAMERTESGKKEQF